MSRQSDTLSLDFVMLRSEIAEIEPSIHISYVCHRQADTKNLFKLIIPTLVSMYHLATSKVCVLDSYWPAVSVLHHKKKLTVIQMWHSLGKIKSSGLANVGKPSGRSKIMSQALNMHQNYNFVVGGGKAWNKFYVESFGVKEEQILNYGLPRMDYIISSKDNNADTFYSKYPQAKGKKILLYAPTHRKNMNQNWQALLKCIDYDKFVLIVKSHKNQPLEFDNPKVYTCPEFSATQLLSVSDYLITDYSSIAIEAAVANVKTCYYVFDYEEYFENNGINIDLFEEMPGCVFKDPAELMSYISEESYDHDSLKMYREKYLPDEIGTSTERLATFVISCTKNNS